MAARQELPRDVKGGQVKQWSDLPTLMADTDMGATLPGPSICSSGCSGSFVKGLLPEENSWHQRKEP